MSVKNGRVYLVGAGCGDYDLITVRGRDLLERCDTVVYDSLIDERLLSFVPKECERICVGKRKGKVQIHVAAGAVGLPEQDVEKSDHMRRV